MTKYVVGFMFNEKKDKVLLIRKNRPEWQKGRLNGVGGHIEEYDRNENQAMIREFREETNILHYGWKHFANIIRNNYDDKDYNVYFYYSISDIMYEYENATDEVIEIVSLDSFPRNDVIYNLNWLIFFALDKSVVEPVIVYDVG